MDVREMIDACMYHEAEYALTKGRKLSFSTSTAKDAPTKCIQCAECGTWHPDVFDECPYCFK